MATKNIFKAFTILYKILPKALRRKVVFTGANSFLMIGLDLLGLGLLLPLLVMILGENNITEQSTTALTAETTNGTFPYSSIRAIAA